MIVVKTKSQMQLAGKSGLESQTTTTLSKVKLPLVRADLQEEDF